MIKKLTSAILAISIIALLIIGCSSTTPTTSTVPTTSAAPITTAAPTSTANVPPAPTQTTTTTTAASPSTSTPPTTATTKPIELKLGHTWPTGSFMDITFNKWADKIKADSNGRLVIRVYPGATLATAPGTYKAVADGVMDIGAAYRYGAPGSEFVTSLSTMFASIPDANTATKVLDDVRVQFKDVFDREWKDVKVLWIVAECGANIVTVNKPVYAMSDIKGLQIRVPVQPVAEEIKALGGTSVTMPLTDLTTALQKNTVNGCTMQFYSLKTYKIADLTKYCTMMPLYAPPDYETTMNWNSYNSLPNDLKIVIDDSLAWGKGELLKSYSQADEDGIAYGTSMGIKYITLTPEEKARWFLVLRPIQDAQAAALDAKGYPDSQTLKFVRERIAQYLK